MKQVASILLTLILVTLASCGGGSKWKLEGNLQGLSGGTLRLVWLNDAGTVSEATAAVNGDRFTAEGRCSGPTIVAIYHGQSRLLTTIVVDGGKKLQIKGLLMKPYELQAKGVDLCERWMAWRAEHTRDYQSADASVLNKKTEDYVKGHPKDELSTLLTVADYYPDNVSETMELLSKIDKSARLPSLVSSLSAAQALYVEQPPALGIISLWNTAGEREPIRPQDADRTVLLLWNTSWLSKREETIERINAMRDSVERLNVYAIYMEADTQAWRPTIRYSDLGAWHHLWAPAGIAQPALGGIGLRQLPALVVVNNVGHIESVKYIDRN